MSNEPIQPGMHDLDGRGLEAAREELLCCPFCGDGHAFIEGHPTARMVTCNKCGAFSGQFDSDEAAIAAWNRRASSPNIGEVAGEYGELDAGINYAIEQLCAILEVAPSSISWDAATETLDGDVSSVICNVLRAAYGDDWSSNPGDTARIRSALVPSPQQHSSQADTPGIPATGSGETGWRDIASAPKDGTKFDVWQGGRRVVDVYWSNVEDAWAVDGMYGPEEPAPLAIFPPVTHWMPLPASPANPAETQAVEVGTIEGLMKNGSGE